ncbi:4-hydroxy-3-methylbut-2-enyl diphosphate reductase [Thiolinea disciformis]|uniref:4-hydroxy-3-methylbut-2-enyl diphosphate reductase n=1 Tax=Thiolinea disciformis TaxID=125614 RepID=UPI000365348C|nr:4-hydroxy-3-methylbut-2-enyl diphosphate reductase [Thiolinea disciformis]
MQVTLANPRGFCAGVDRAIEIVDRALEVLGAPIYVRHEVVHNRFVVNNLRDKGAIFVQELDEVPDGATVIFSAHGVSRAVQDEAKQRGLKVFDATCPLVTKVHVEVTRYSREGRETILIGHKNHPEVEGTMGQYEIQHGGQIYRVDSPEEVNALQVNNPAKLAFVTQTTLSVDDTSIVIDALRHKFPAIIGPKKDDICYATQNRQDALKQLAEDCDLILVVGSPNSSNSNRLREMAEKRNTPAYLIDDASDIKPEWLQDKQHIGLTAGASAPEVLVEGVIERLKLLGVNNVQIQDSGITEHVAFVLPRELRRTESSKLSAHMPDVGK